MIDTIVNSFAIWTDAQGIKSRIRVSSVENISLEGIARLRELILELAVLGKLVPQDPIEEPASVLLKRIEKERKENGTLRKRKKDEQPYTGQIFNSQIQGWELCKLEDIGDTNIGLTYSPNDVSVNGIIVLRSSNIQNGEIELSDLVRVNKKINENVLVKQGDLLICARNGSKKLVGKCALIRSLPEPMAFGAFMAIFRSPFNEYCRLFIESPIYRRNLEGVTTTTINQITQDNLKSTYIPLPPFAEQHRIVAKVDELMALCDKLEEEQFNNLKTHQVLVKTLLKTLTQATDAHELQAAWERISEYFEILFCTDYSIDQLKQTILQLAITGKLVKQDIKDEPANELFKKITAAKEELIKAGKIKKQAPLSEIAEHEKTFALPKGWIWKKLNDVIDVRDGTHDTPKEAFGDNTYPLITSQNFENGKINFENAKRISEFDHLEISKRSLVERHDILFSMIGGNLGNQVMVDTDTPFSIKNVALFKYYNKDYTAPSFIKKIMEHIALSLQSRAIGGAQPFVSLGVLRNIVIALPPIAEQYRIVRKVDELFTLCASLQAKILKSQDMKTSLAKTIVEKAAV